MTVISHPVAAATLPPGFVRGPGPARDARWRPGLPEECRHGEIFAPANEASGTALALALALDRLRAPGPGEALRLDDRAWLWVQDKAAIRLSGRPYRPGLPAALRHRLVHVAAAGAGDALFALEEGLRCRDLAFVVGEIAGNPRSLDFTASRRLSLAAERHGVPLWLVRLDAARDLGAARMRWSARAAPSSLPLWNPHAPGAPAWDAELFRAHTYQPGRWRLEENEAGLGADHSTGPAPTDGMQDGELKTVLSA